MMRFQPSLLAIFVSIFLYSGHANANGYEGYMSSLDSALQKKIQETLSGKGFDPGPIDGKFGQRSIEALENFQESISFSNCSETGDDDPIGEVGGSCTIEDLLTPRLIKALWGIDVEPGDDGINLSPDEQLEVLQELGLIPSTDYWEKRGYVFPD